ncbi:MAG: DUF2179 domain-containing protein [Anaerolineae bacterium]|nr:DUF2179 domain-containing protein [Anaerolineae bacterium]
MDVDTLLLVLAILALRIFGLGLATVRTLMMVRGRKAWATFISLIEFATYTFSLGWVIQDLTNPWNVAAYCGGSAAGIYLGMVIESRYMGGFASIDVISPGKAHDIAEAVRAAGFGATESVGHGADGTVGMVRVVTRRQEIGAVLETINRTDPKAFVTVEETRALRHGYLRQGR